MSDVKEGAGADLETIKAQLAEARKSLAELEKENDLKKGNDYSKHPDEKVAKSWRVRSKKVDELSALYADLKGKSTKKEKKEKAPAAPREVKYAYPEGINADEKKKFRIKQRSNAKKAGVELDTFLKDPAKYADVIKAKEAEGLARKEEAMAKAQAKLKENKAEKAAAAAETAAPVAKKKAAVAPASVPAKKKKVAVEEED